MLHSDGKILTFETEKDSSPEKASTGGIIWSWKVPAIGIQTDPISDESSTVLYIGNKNSMKLHYANCTSVDDMKESNKVEFYSRDEAINLGYVPCKRCNP